jgi:Holliday junction resolvasome RuvABC DNA-binding subunit
MPGKDLHLAPGQEDAHRLWGFKDPAEMYFYLISISGIGPNTAGWYYLA